MTDPDPIPLFHRWQREAQGGAGSLRERLRTALHRASRKAFYLATGEGLPHADAAALATSTREGVPSVRMVLVKEASGEGFVFYTNYGSRKARELEDNPVAELAFHWPFPPRQVRVAGPVTRVTWEESDAYWRSRPLASQLGALASHQSEPIPDREHLVRRFRELRERLRGEAIPCPDFWGGYRLRPDLLEFWEGRGDRLHDRLAYTRRSAGGWEVLRLAP